MTTFYRSPTWRAATDDATPAPFATMEEGGQGHPWQAFHLTVPGESGAGSQYFVFIRMFWYRAGGVEGTVTHRLDDYVWWLSTGAYGFGDPSCFTKTTHTS